MTTVKLHPIVVLVPQWIIDEINQMVIKATVVNLLTDEMRANGWSAEALAGGMMFSKAVRDILELAP